MGNIIAIVTIVLFACVLIFAFFSFIPVLLWIEAFAAGVKVSLGTLVGMRLRRVRPYRIIKPLIKGTKAGLELDTKILEELYLAGGDVENVVNALIASHRANINLDFDKAKGIQLAGRDVYEAVQMSVTPKVIEIPEVAAIAKDGIELNATAKVTVRADIDRLIGGAGEETIIARVGEGIVTTVGSAETHKKVLENPDLISKTVLQKGLDAGTAYEILSIDIADVDVGRNVGAKLQMDQAQADKNIAQAKAEVRRAMAVAKEQEMKAQVIEMKSRLVQAEAEVPQALAKALREGKMGAMDYYNMKNVIADTEMRKSISDMSESESENDEE